MKPRSGATRTERAAVAWYRVVSRVVLPADFWAAHGEPMVAVFAESFAEASARGAGAQWRCLWRETSGAIRVAGAERTRRRHDRVNPTPLWRTDTMYEFVRDVRLALRSMWRGPAFTAVVVLTLGLGVGANTAIFSVVNGVLLQPLPYAAPNELVRGFTTYPNPGFERFWFSWGQYSMLRERNESFANIATYGHTRSWNVSGLETPLQVKGAQVTHTLIPTLGVNPLLGRNFTATEDVPNGPGLVILGYDVWQRLFAGDPAAIGRTIDLNGMTREVIAVMPPGFRLPTEFDAPQPAETFVPMGRAYAPQTPGAGSQNFNLVARLRPGLTVAAADQNIKAVLHHIRDDFDWSDGFTGLAVPLTEEVVGDVRPALLILLSTVGLVLLIACANVANLMLARSESRQREVGVRVALGAGRGRLIRHLLTESLMYATAGGVVAVGLAHFGVRALIAVDPTSIPRTEAISTDGTVLVFTAALSLVTGALFGVIPALHASKADLQDTLKEGSRGSTTGGRLRLGRTLAVSEFALAFVLAIGAGLLIRSFWNLRSIESGLETENVLTLNTYLPEAAYPDAESVSRFYTDLVNRTTSLPGVSHAAVINQLPLGSSAFDWAFTIEGRPVPEGEAMPNADYGAVSRDYFSAVGMTLLRGRMLTEFDRDADNPVVVINETMAELYWPDDDPVGKRISLFGPPVWHEVIGIVSDVRNRGLTADTRPQMFLEHRQFGALGAVFRPLNLVVRATSDPRALVPAIRGVFRALDRNIPFAQIRTLDDIVAGSIAQERFSMILLGVFATLALSLAAIGIYGVMAFSVAQRAQEIGIRMALGADRVAVRTLVVQQGMQSAFIGLAVGLGLALLLTRGVRTLLFGVGNIDPVTYLVVGVTLLGVAYLANYVPALRASRGDPMLALRNE